MNRSTQYINTVFLLKQIGYEPTCVKEGEKDNIWIWSFDKKIEHTIPVGYGIGNVAIMMAPELYKGEPAFLVRQVLQHGQEHYPVFSAHLELYAVDIILKEKALWKALNFLIKQIQLDETLISSSPILQEATHGT